MALAISRYLIISSLVGMAVFIPFSISGMNISFFVGVLGAGIAFAVDRRARKQYLAVRHDPLFWPALILVASALPSVFMSQHFSRAFNDWQSHWLMLFYFFVAYNARDERLQRIMFWTLLSSAALSCVVQMIQYFGGLDLVLFKIESNNFRPGGTLYTMTYAGILYQLITVSAAVAIGSRRINRRTMAIAGAAVLCTISLLITLTRGAWIALVGGMVAVIAVSRRRAVLVGGIIVMVAIAVFALVNPTLRARVDMTVHEGYKHEDVYTRLVLWDIAKELFLDHPLLGVGMGDFSAEAERRLDGRKVTTVVDAHNIFLHILATRGLLGFLPFVFYWIVIFRMLADIRARLADDPFGRSFAVGVLAAAVAVLIGALTENNVDDSEVYMCFLFLLGFARSLVLRSRALHPVVAGTDPPRPRSQPQQTSP